MQILFLNTIGTILLDILAWIMFHLGIGYCTSKMDIAHFNPASKFYQAFKWEKNGEIYEKIFKVHSWKKFIPNGSALYKEGYSIKNLRSTRIEDIDQWIKESCRAEFCHWVMIIPGFLFFLWNSVEAGWAMVVYAVANNLVPIIMQRYNRPRALKFMKILERKGEQLVQPYEKVEEMCLNPYC